MSLLLQEEEIADLVSDVSLHSTMSLLLRRMAKKTMRQRSFLYIPLCLYYYVEQVYPGEIKFTLHSTMSLLLRGIICITDLLDFFTFHYVSITT